MTPNHGQNLAMTEEDKDKCALGKIDKWVVVDDSSSAKSMTEESSGSALQMGNADNSSAKGFTKTEEDKGNSLQLENSSAKGMMEDSSGSGLGNTEDSTGKGMGKTEEGKGEDSSGKGMDKGLGNMEDSSAKGMGKTKDSEEKMDAAGWTTDWDMLDKES